MFFLAFHWSCCHHPRCQTVPMATEISTSLALKRWDIHRVINLHTCKGHPSICLTEPQKNGGVAEGRD